MRRIRQVSAERPAPVAVRLACAFAVSLGIHAALLMTPGTRPGWPEQQRAVVLHATLVDAPRQSAMKVVAPRESRPAPFPVEDLPLRQAEVIPPPLAMAAPANALQPEPMGFPAASDPVHYEAKDLDTYPRLRSPLSPAYPPDALTQRIAGAVTVLVSIDETGRVTEAAVIDAAPEGTFDETAREALARASFLPASKDGRVVRSRILVSIAFDPEKP